MHAKGLGEEACKDRTCGGFLEHVVRGQKCAGIYVSLMKHS